jgi:hypothetical protein
MDWVIANKEWLFSGVLIAVPLAIIGWFYKSTATKQIQKSGKNSTNIQVGGNITINQNKDHE